MPSSILKKLLALLTLVLTQWAVLAHARPNQLEPDNTEPITPPGYESVADNPWLKTQLNPQTPDYPESVSVGTGNSSVRDTPNAVFIQTGYSY